MRLQRAPAPSSRDKIWRLAWAIVGKTIYRWSPLSLFRWRCFLLKAFGAQISGRAYPYPTARIWAPWNLEMGPGSCIGPNVICYSVTLIALGANSLVSQGAHLCAATHDHRDPSFPLVVGSITIGDDAWVAAEAFIGPGVSISERAVVGARSVVMKDVPAGIVVGGNPARPIARR